MIMYLFLYQKEKQKRLSEERRVFGFSIDAEKKVPTPQNHIITFPILIIGNKVDLIIGHNPDVERMKDLK